MVSKTTVYILIIVNILMAFLLYLSSQQVLLLLKGSILQDYNTFSIYNNYVEPAGSTPVPASRLPLVNFPFYAFLLFLIVNIIIVIKLQRSKET